VWLGRRDAELSTLDLFGPGFTLLTTSEGAAWRTAAAGASHALRIPIVTYSIGGTGLQDRGGFAQTYGLGSEGAVLIRPDGHVAWRSPLGPVTGIVLSAALKRILGR
jgi:hypothetical protein